MLGASGSAMLVGKLAREVGKNMGKEDHATGFDENDLVSIAQENRRDGWQTGGEGVGWQGRCQGCAVVGGAIFRGDNLCDVQNPWVADWPMCWCAI